MCAPCQRGRRLRLDGALAVEKCDGQIQSNSSTVSVSGQRTRQIFGALNEIRWAGGSSSSCFGVVLVTESVIRPGICAIGCFGPGTYIVSCPGVLPSASISRTLPSPCSRGGGVRATHSVRLIASQVTQDCDRVVPFYLCPKAVGKVEILERCSLLTLTGGPSRLFTVCQT